MRDVLVVRGAAGHKGALERKVGVMTGKEGEGMSITRELREYVACWYHTRALVDVADRIDERFSRELQAKQDEVDALRAKLDASEPTETIEDVRHTVGRGYTYLDQDVLCAIDHAYACGKRDGAGEMA